MKRKNQHFQHQKMRVKKAHHEVTGGRSGVVDNKKVCEKFFYITFYKKRNKHGGQTNKTDHSVLTSRDC